ncbi:unnamed protein product [Heligmosomoides polygyrus]|uniref:MBD domain-containing protein n=1 Tax=Heligmosomoides polygyrus TaxID=6339 RepID=A0A183GRZ1_HELPZ|nr:unnamed protein product [Heligmosomoides polygyrus]
MLANTEKLVSAMVMTMTMTMTTTTNILQKPQQPDYCQVTDSWRRQTCIRSIAASGVRGDVVYYAPCGKKLSTYAEVLRYLMKNPCTTITRDNFSFSSKLIVGEFLMPKEVESGEKKVSEEAVAEEVNRLVSLKPQPRNVELDKVGKEIGWKEVTELNRNAVHRQLDELNGKISSARIAIKGAASGFMKPGTGNGSMEELRQRIITCERRVNRNFLRPSFFVGKCYHFFHLECVPDATYDPSVDFLCRGCDPKNRDAKRPLKRKADAPPPLVFPTDMNNDLCRAMLDELECQPGVGPFLEPVDLDLVPGYREAIANPIDMASIRNRIEAQW